MNNDDGLDWIRDVDSYIHFDDLEFNPHPNQFIASEGGVQATGHFPSNGKWYSVVTGYHGFYVNGDDSYEVYGDDMEDPLGYLSRDGVEEWLMSMQTT
jgi:hypothetical protein